MATRKKSEIKESDWALRNRHGQDFRTPECNTQDEARDKTVTYYFAEAAVLSSTCHTQRELRKSRFAEKTLILTPVDSGHLVVSSIFQSILRMSGTQKTHQAKNTDLQVASRWTSNEVTGMPSHHSESVLKAKEPEKTGEWEPKDRFTESSALMKQANKTKLQSEQKDKSQETGQLQKATVSCLVLKEIKSEIEKQGPQVGHSGN